MKTSGRMVGAALAGTLCATGCQDGEPPPKVHAALEVAATASGDCQPVRELAKLDRRQPVPLQPMMAWHQKQNMMEHLVAIQRITAGLAREDWAEVASASALLESSEQMQQMCQHMGAGAEGFTESALDFHRRADAIGEAARAEDAASVLRATSDTLQACTGCHAVFRQEVVSAAAWRERAAHHESSDQLR